MLHPWQLATAHRWLASWALDADPEDLTLLGTIRLLTVQVKPTPEPETVVEIMQQASRLLADAAERLSDLTRQAEQDIGYSRLESEMVAAETGLEETEMPPLRAVERLS